VAVDRRLVLGLDWVMLGAVLLLAALGVATIFSATQETRLADLYLKQLYAIGLGLCVLVLAIMVDYRRLADRAPLFYAAALGVLAYLLLLGPRIAGTQRWLQFGSVQVQPAELVKIAAALFAAKVLGESRKESLGLFDVAAPGVALGLLALLIAAQPDLGSAFCIVPLFLTIAFLAGLRMRAILGLLAVMALVGGLGWRYALKDYQKSRIYSFLDPSLDPKGVGYQKIQSQIAVGSGGLLGKGYGKGSQSQLGYLPARHTDFAFSVLAEELGFLGVAVTLGLYLLVLWRALETAQLARDRVGAFLAAGLAAVLAFQVVYNVAMVAGLVPVKGLPLPLLSYGGSSVVATLLSVGLILNVRVRRFVN
jgi:rod shape determining protein RodA